MKIKILLADDHKILRDGLRSLIKKHHELEIIGEAENGQKAVQLAYDLKPDIVIMDISMPDMDGIEATQRILDKKPDVNVIALSMHSDSRFIGGMMKAGASGYLLKESAFEELVKAIHTVSEGNIYISPSIADVVVGDYVDHLKRDIKSECTSLTTRECEVLKLLAEGINLKEVAYKLNISKKTVETHRRHIMEKLVIQSTAGLTKFAIRMGLISINY